MALLDASTALETHLVRDGRCLFCAPFFLNPPLAESLFPNGYAIYPSALPPEPNGYAISRWLKAKISWRKQLCLLGAAEFECQREDAPRKAVMRLWVLCA